MVKQSPSMKLRVSCVLCTASMFRKYQLSFWILEDYGTDNWTLKHTVTTLEIFGWDNIQFGYDVCDADYKVIAVHLDWNLIFLVGEDKKLIAYDMNLRKVLILPTQVVWYRRPTWRLRPEGPHYLPYVPLFMKSVGEQ